MKIIIEKSKKALKAVQLLVQKKIKANQLFCEHLLKIHELWKKFVNNFHVFSLHFEKKLLSSAKKKTLSRFIENINYPTFCALLSMTKDPKEVLYEAKILYEKEALYEEKVLGSPEDRDIEPEDYDLVVRRSSNRRTYIDKLFSII